MIIITIIIINLLQESTAILIASNFLNFHLQNPYALESTHKTVNLLVCLWSIIKHKEMINITHNKIIIMKELINHHLIHRYSTTYLKKLLNNFILLLFLNMETNLPWNQFKFKNKFAELFLYLLHLELSKLWFEVKKEVIAANDVIYPELFFYFTAIVDLYNEI